MALEFKNAYAASDEVISLQEMVLEGAHRELRCSKLEGIMQIRKLFQMISNFFNEEFFPIEICWVSTPKNPEEVHKQYSVSVRCIIEYLDNCVFPGTIECHRRDSTTEYVGDEFLIFHPARLMDFIQENGVAWVPGKGAMLVTEIPPSLLKGGPDPQPIVAGFPYLTSQVDAMQKAAQRFWIDFDRQRPPLQKTISSFIADLLGLDGPNRTTNTLAAAIRPDDVPNER